MRPWVRWAAGIGLLATIGCDKDAASTAAPTAAATQSAPRATTKIRQCNNLIETINETQERLKKNTGSDPAALKQLATTLDASAKTVQAVELTDAKLVKFRDEYSKMAKDLGKAARAAASALEASDAEKAQEAAKTMSGFGKRESDLVDDVNKYCSGEESTARNDAATKSSERAGSSSETSRSRAEVRAQIENALIREEMVAVGDTVVMRSSECDELGATIIGNAFVEKYGKTNLIAGGFKKFECRHPAGAIYTLTIR